jgi:type III pantothenate kinase
MREFVADVGNSRIKWGECARDGLGRTTAVPLDNPDAWAKQLRDWDSPTSSTWTLAGTHPEARDRLADWLRRHGHAVHIIDSFRMIPVHVRVDHPERVGIDRLLNAAAVLSKGVPAVVIDAGSAVTVDLIDGEGAFRGGVIFPGYRLMAKALNDYTARLPLVEEFTEPVLPGTNTAAAINAGVASAVAGGIDRAVRRLSQGLGPTRVFLAGGDAERLTDLDCRPEVAGPYLTLEGIRITARHLA